MVVSLDMEPTLRQYVSPRLIEANHILSLSLVELEETIQAELAANPALEVEDGPLCPRCGALQEGAYCVTCHLDQREPDQPMSAEDGVGHASVAARADVSDDFDPMTLIASEVSLVECILSDVVTQIEPVDAPIAEFLLNSLDERGYLDTSIDEVARRIDRPVAAVERILRVVQQLAPAGVAARDLRECLLLQLVYLAQQPEASIPPAVWPIVTAHLDDLAAHRYGLIARRLGLSTADVNAAHGFIRSALTPFPLQNREARCWKATSRLPYAMPDVVVLARDGEFEIELVQSRAARLRLDPLYASLATGLSPGDRQFATEERSHIRQHVQRARLFIGTIHQRAETLRRITECVLECQREFVVHGVRALAPLTRGQVAERVGVHESTVSRATANKYLMLPCRQVIPYSTFFIASLSTKDIMREMIEREPRVLTDQEICERLRRQGIRIARRTVAKYRATIGIPSSLLRANIPASA